jgi:hypothetical protein
MILYKDKNNWCANNLIYELICTENGRSSRNHVLCATDVCRSERGRTGRVCIMIMEYENLYLPANSIVEKQNRENK